MRYGSYEIEKQSGEVQEPMKVFMFNHSGSLNRGCEAIVRGTVTVINRCCKGNGYVLSSYAPLEDDIVKDLVKVVPFEPGVLNKTQHLKAAMKIRISKDESYSIIKSYSSFFEEAEAADICLSIGGDTYCYGDNTAIQVLTKELKNKGKKVILWGASIGEEDLTADKENNLACFDAIFAREPLTYVLLKNRNIHSKIFQFPDPAFTLEKEELPLPGGWLENQTVGINISSIVAEKNPALIPALAGLIQYILKNTELAVALIPHVTAFNNNDLPALEALLKEAKAENNGRVFILPGNLNAKQYKGYIARLRYFIGARTHATIAAYTSLVPTIVLGYSVKSRGISEDLFGEDRFVLNANALTSISDCIESFDALREQEDEIKAKLAVVIPEKIKAAFQAGPALMEV